MTDVPENLPKRPTYFKEIELVKIYISQLGDFAKYYVTLHVFNVRLNLKHGEQSLESNNSFLIPSPIIWTTRYNVRMVCVVTSTLNHLHCNRHRIAARNNGKQSLTHVIPHVFNTKRYLAHWGRDKMDVISQTTFPSAFSWMKMF